MNLDSQRWKNAQILLTANTVRGTSQGFPTMYLGEKMTETKGLSIEEMQKQLADANERLEKQTQEIETLKKSSEENQKSLAEARDLNSKLLLRVPSLSDEQKPAEEEDSVEKIFDEVVSAMNEKLLKKYAEQT